MGSYPRSGSVWLRFLLVEMLGGGASFASTAREAPLVGEHRHSPELVPGGGRLIKTHEQHIAHYRRAIHLVRDPRDVAISYFYFLQRLEKIVIRPGDDEAASFDHHIDAFLSGRVDAFGTWQAHVESWLKAEQQGLDIIRVRYEDLSSDPSRELQRVAAWLGKPITVDDASQVVERCTFEQMQQAESNARNQNFFNRHAMRSGIPVVRQGRAGGWRQVLTDAQQARFAVFAEGIALMDYEAVGAAAAGANASPRPVAG